MTEFERECESVGRKIIVRNSKVLGVKKDQRESYEIVRVTEEEIQKVEKFNYLRVKIS